MAFVIPTIFTAVNRLSSPVNAMAASVNSLGVSAARAQVSFNNLFPTIDNTVNRMTDFTKSAALAGAAIGGIYFLVKAIVDYQKALASFRIVVDDLSEADFSKFQKAVSDVANKTRSGMVDVAKAFKNIAELNPELAKTAESISAVTESAILLSRASGEDLEASANALAGTLNQFNLAGKDAMRVANALAAGAAIGAASISSMNQALKNLGPVALSANMSVERTVAMLQVLGKFGITEAEAGTKAKRAILQLQAANVGYKTGQFDLAEALETVKKRYDSLSTEMAKNNYIQNLFGKEGVAAGEVLLRNIGLLTDYEKKSTDTQEAVKQAAIATNTLAFAINWLSDKFKNLMIQSSGGNLAMTTFRDIIMVVADNLGLILNVVTLLIGPMLLFKAAVWGVAMVSKVATFWTNAFWVAQGLVAFFSGKSAAALLGNSVAMWAYTAATRAAAIASALLNASMGVFGLVLAVIFIALPFIIKYFDQWGASVLFVGTVIAAVMSPAIAIILGLVSVVMSLYRNWEHIKESFTKGGFLKGILAIGAALFDAILYPLQQIFKLIGDLTGWNWAKSASNGINNFRGGMGLDTSGTPQIDTTEENVVGGGGYVNKSQVINNMAGGANTATPDINVNVQVDRSGNVSIDSTGANVIPFTSSTVRF